MQFRTLRLQMERKTEILPHFNLILTLSETQMKFLFIDVVSKKNWETFLGICLTPYAFVQFERSKANFEGRQICFRVSALKVLQKRVPRCRISYRLTR